MRDKELIDFINEKLNAPTPEAQDLGVTLPQPKLPSIARLVRGYAIEEITPPPRPLPKPPYRCICGIVFKTAEKLLEHRHD